MEDSDVFQEAVPGVGLWALVFGLELGLMYLELPEAQDPRPKTPFSISPTETPAQYPLAHFSTYPAPAASALE
jgi:hypothetical protein